jgi:DNA-binding GntR family transcriptional regulator
VAGRAVPSRAQRLMLTGIVAPAVVDARPGSGTIVDGIPFAPVSVVIEHTIEGSDPASIRSMALHVARLLRDRIVRGEFKGGERIVERRVCDELCVSRTPVREALKLLEADGLIQILRNRGAQVTRLDADDALLLFEVVAALEGLAAGRLATHATPEVMDRLEDLHARILFHYHRSQIDPYSETNSAAHDLIVSACGNPVLASHHARSMPLARRGRYLAIMSPGRWAQSVDEHDRLMQALRDRDPDAAATIWTTHLRHSGESLAAVLREDASR